MSDLVPFTYEGSQVRTVNLDGEPWFIAADVCAALALRDTSSGLKMVDPEDAQRFRRSDTPQFFGGIAPQVQEIAAVNESGVYALIFHSRKPEAKAFKRWVTHEVIPAIRRTGRYETAPALPDITTPAGVLAMAEQFAATARQLVAAEAKVAEQHHELVETHAYLDDIEPDAEAFRVIATNHVGDYSAKEAASVLSRDPRINLGQNKLLALLREWKVLDGRDYPYAAHGRHFHLKPQVYDDPHTGEQREAKPQVRITWDGLSYIRRRLLAPTGPDPRQRSLFPAPRTRKRPRPAVGSPDGALIPGLPQGAESGE